MTAADEGIDLGRGVRLQRGDVTWRFSTAGGPGGQHVNTSNTRAEATVDVDVADLPDWARQRIRRQLGAVVTVAAGDTRSQARNRDLALDRLADRLREALKPPPPQRRPTRPTAASQRRRLEDKRRRAQLKSQRRKREDGE
ncbi:MAG TPA: alternative ribosome rescue aminoacyl-tRNA hydrolase ArfB [Acidimicrobiales bacterium]|nr:alternative ribosome rescue aminoacyl-tRNA hydrolase ArfB [Acidimicrobiales bacterium]